LFGLDLVLILLLALDRLVSGRGLSGEFVMFECVGDWFAACLFWCLKLERVVSDLLSMLPVTLAFCSMLCSCSRSHGLIDFLLINLDSRCVACYSIQACLYSK
jgi:hypothetical protein